MENHQPQNKSSICTLWLLLWLTMRQKCLRALLKSTIWLASNIASCFSKNCIKILWQNREFGYIVIFITSNQSFFKNCEGTVQKRRRNKEWWKLPRVVIRVEITNNFSRCLGSCKSHTVRKPLWAFIECSHHLIITLGPPVQTSN